MQQSHRSWRRPPAIVTAAGQCGRCSVSLFLNETDSTRFISGEGSCVLVGPAQCPATAEAILPFSEATSSQREHLLGGCVPDAVLQGRVAKVRAVCHSCEQAGHREHYKTREARLPPVECAYRRAEESNNGQRWRRQSERSGRSPSDGDNFALWRERWWR